MCNYQHFKHLLGLHIYITFIHCILHMISQQDISMVYNHVNLTFFCLNRFLFFVYIYQIIC